MTSSPDAEAEQAAFFGQQYPRLAGWAARLLDDEEAGRDVAAEAFVRALSRWSSLSDPAGFLYVTAANQVRDRWRREGTRRRALPFLRQQVRAPAPAHDNAVRDLVERLPERTRLPILLHYYADLTADDIARHLGTPPGSVRRLLAEGRSTLRQALEDAT